jgi:hypothetical protein
MASQHAPRQVRDKYTRAIAFIEANARRPKQDG